MSRSMGGIVVVFGIKAHKVWRQEPPDFVFEKIAI